MDIKSVLENIAKETAELKEKCAKLEALTTEQQKQLAEKTTQIEKLSQTNTKIVSLDLDCSDELFETMMKNIEKQIREGKVTQNYDKFRALLNQTQKENLGENISNILNENIPKYKSLSYNEFTLFNNGIRLFDKQDENISTYGYPNLIFELSPNIINLIGKCSDRSHARVNVKSYVFNVYVTCKISLGGYIYLEFHLPTMNNNYRSMCVTITNGGVFTTSEKLNDALNLCKEIAKFNSENKQKLLEDLRNYNEIITNIPEPVEPTKSEEQAEQADQAEQDEQDEQPSQMNKKN